MKVIKRDGTEQEVQFDKIKARLVELSDGLKVEVDAIAQKAIGSMYNGVSTREIDEHLSRISCSYSIHPDYNTLAGRICVSSLHKETSLNHFTKSKAYELKDKILSGEKIKADDPLIVQYLGAIYKDEKRERFIKDVVSGKKKFKEDFLKKICRVSRFFYSIDIMNQEGVINDEVLKFVQENREALEDKIDYDRDMMFDYFGYKTLERAYLLRRFYKQKVKTQVVIQDEHGNDTGEMENREINETKFEIIERPQDMFMRVSVAILRKEDDALTKIFEMYDLMSQGYYTHATPTLFNAGTKREQLSSCFLLYNEKDSVDGIFSTFAEEAAISKNSGGIGVAVSNIRAKGSIIKGTNGVSKGIINFLKIKNAIARGIDQGGKRKGSFAVYLEPWHADVENFIRLRRPDGAEEDRARDLFLALWMPDLFYERVKDGGKWSLFDPSTAPGLIDAVGDDFKALYEKYEKEGLALKILDAREFMKDIFEQLMETGSPYILNKDHANRKSNQKNLGTIKSSNLCTEIMEYTDEKESAVCNLCSVCLPKFVKSDGTFDYDSLHRVVRTAIRNLNTVIDVNYYVNEKTRRSNMRHRPVGLGVQGLADVFFMMKLPYVSKEAQEVNEQIFETIYHAAISESLAMAKKDGHYESMKENGGAPISKGIFQFDMWNHTPSSGRYDKSKGDKLSWDELREEVKIHGVRNSLLIAPMPTASTSQIFGNTESFEPLTQNLYRRETLSGEFTIANKYLIRQLEEMGLWSQEVQKELIVSKGSVQDIKFLPDDVKEIYKTVWELPMKPQVDMAADRGAYICQSQSFNVHMEEPSMEKMKNLYLYAHDKGLKTASYYFRTVAARDAQIVTAKKKGYVAETEDSEDEDCLVCGS